MTFAIPYDRSKPIPAAVPPRQYDGPTVSLHLDVQRETGSTRPSRSGHPSPVPRGDQGWIGN